MACNKLQPKSLNKKINNSHRRLTKLGERNVEVRPVGAWVEPEYYSGSNFYEAVISAQEEEQRMLDVHRAKQQQLKQFQLEVKQRVQNLAQKQKLEQLKKSYQAVEVERNVLSQSAKSAEKNTPRKNCCAIRNEESLVVKHSAPKIHSRLQGAVITSSGTSKDYQPSDVLKKTHNQVHENNLKARHKLMRCRVATDVYEDTDLPGGRWNDLQDNEKENEETNNIGFIEDSEPITNKTVHFDLTDDETEIASPGYKSSPYINGETIERAPQLSTIPPAYSSFPPPLHPDVNAEEQRHLVMKQRATYRRLFMDIEREQVKENIRRKEHRKHIHKFKKEKENERRRLEEECWKSLEVADPITGETVEEMEDKQEQQRLRIVQHEEQQQKAQQHMKDMQRYVEALRCNLQDKVKLRGIDLPPLCCCGTTVWDTNPTTCANNCVFYKNPKAYAKVLQSLLASCDVV